MSLLAYVLGLLVSAPIIAFTPPKGRLYLMLLASLGFYASFDWRFLFLLLGVIGVTYWGGLLLWQHRRRDILALFVFLILGPLLTYKYILVWLSELPSILPVSNLDFGGYGNVIVPVGLSFFTFQCLGYVLDLYRGAYVPERDPIRFSLFVSFFPQLLAGPIERYPSLAPQLWADRRPSADDVLNGLLLVAYGLFMKDVLGDRLGASVDAAFAGHAQASAADALLGFFGFTIQLFADFGGYSLIAVGAAKLFGITLTQNFRQPIFAPDIVDFWQRWHISLTRWVGDYVYRPLGRTMLRISSLSRWLQEAATAAVVWIVIGLWHGATATFLAFGMIQAALILGYKTLPRRRGQRTAARLVFGVAVTFTVVVLTFGLIRAPSLGVYMDMLRAVLEWRPGEAQIVDGKLLAVGLVIVLGVEACRRFIPRFDIRDSIVLRSGLTVALVLATILFGYDDGRSFIYFRF